jgi:NADH pyrophosphatase NudC (nudix superfamily)
VFTIVAVVIAMVNLRGRSDAASTRHRRGIRRGIERQWIGSDIMLHTHCSHCGTAYEVDASWPRVCPGCGETTWLNPLPVAVALVPVDMPVDMPGDLPGGRRGLVAVRRDIEPARGQLALPGGFIEVGESWQEATVR